MAQKCLGIAATSVPSEQLFSTGENIVSSKRAALLLPENVRKLVFLHKFDKQLATPDYLTDTCLT